MDSNSLNPIGVSTKKMTIKPKNSVVGGDLTASIEEERPDKEEEKKKPNEFEDIDEESYEIESSNELNQSGLNNSEKGQIQSKLSLSPSLSLKQLSNKSNKIFPQKQLKRLSLRSKTSHLKRKLQSPHFSKNFLNKNQGSLLQESLLFNSLRYQNRLPVLRQHQNQLRGRKQSGNSLAQTFWESSRHLEGNLEPQPQIRWVYPAQEQQAPQTNPLLHNLSLRIQSPL